MTLRLLGSTAITPATQTALDAKAPLPTWKSGNFYGPANISPSTTRSMVNGTAWVIPILVPRAVTIDRISIEVTTAGITGSTIRLGIYNTAANGEPGTLIVDAGTVDSLSTGGKDATISQALTTGFYFLAAVGQGATTAPVVRAAVGASPGIGSTSNTTVIQGNVVGYNTAAASVSGALPNTLTLNSSAGSAPYLAVRIV